ncbi:hypothetical protein AGMMS49573_01180 [Endomicrobiia bacterium]|nr:hypothetical protein [Candidatus Endomicrobium trichonymphae]GHT09527.1 hypothetical protein AGMMS49532_07800 [Endomicrobiia bacterium]GHT15259.1 hypothetical protein AGMMS49573_01180 [Endomicrobiia bacterium]GHT24247.1 hypothetical protein AGMMS49953_06330 [Endomicrobiia bacterium]GMO53238.1 MAG: hypothetical protein Ta2C_04430 [Candidatus Endomicrobium trichonymphae]
MFSVSGSAVFDLPEYIELETSGDFEISLENALMGIPMVVMYKLSYFNYFFIKAIIKIEYAAIVNILAGRSIVPKFIQFDAKPQKIASSVLELLKVQSYMPKVEKLLAFRKMLGTPGVSRRVAEIILEDWQ